MIGVIAALASTLLSNGATNVAKNLMTSGADKAMDFVKDKTGIDLKSLTSADQLTDEQVQKIKELEANPEYQLELKKMYYNNVQKEREYDKDMKTLDNAHLKVVNDTYKEELKSDSWWAKNWRPLFGITGAISYGAMFFTLILLSISSLFIENQVTIDMVKHTLTELYNIMTDSKVWWPMLTVTGITAWTRGQEKNNKIKAQRDIELAKYGVSITKGSFTDTVKSMMPFKKSAND